jgi:hypothetical protein
MQYKILVPSLAGMATAGMALVPAETHAPMWPVVGIAAVFGALALHFGAQIINRSPKFVDWQARARVAAVRWVAAAAASDVAAVAIAQVIGIRLWPLWLAGLLALVGGQIGIGYAVDYWRRLAPAKPAKNVTTSTVTVMPTPAAEVGPGTEIALDRERSVVVAGRDWDTMSHDEQIMALVLREAGYGWLNLIGHELIRDEDTETVLGARFTVRVPASRIAGNNKNTTISGEASEGIAIALSERLGVDLESRFVQVEKQPQAGTYAITIVTEDTLSRIYPYMDAPQWTSVKTPAHIGYGLDAKPVYQRLDQHSQAIGQTRSGKSSLIDVELAHLTLCEDAVVWVGGTEKVYDLIGGWLEPYLDTEHPHPFDFLAQGAQDTADMLASLMMVARYRQGIYPLSARTGLPTIVMYLDEASFALRNKTVTAYYNGQRLIMSQLAANVGQGAGSAGCWLKYATQRDTNDQLGENGGDLQAQVGYTAAFSISDSASIGRLLGDYRLEVPRHKGEFWLGGMGAEVTTPRLVKSRYVQSADPSKPKLHNGPTVSEVSWARRHFPRVLDEGSQRAAGQAYARRRTHVTRDLMAYVTGSGAAAPASSPAQTRESVTINRPTTESAESVEVPAVDPAELRQLAESAGVDLDAMTEAELEGFTAAVAEVIAEHGSLAAFLAGGGQPAETPEAAAPAAPTAPGRTRAERIIDIVANATEPLASRQIIAALRAAGDDLPNDVAAYNQMKKLVDAGTLRKREDSRYEIPVNATASTAVGHDA